jgi:glutamyl-tRNA reductase
MHFVVVGLSHKTAPLEIRERFAIPEGEVRDLLTKLLQDEDVQEGMLISTCNRVEAYLVSKHLQRAASAARRLFSGVARLEEGELENYLYVREAEEAIAHLFRVASSLDSLIVGEPQISGQVKEAYTQAVACQATGTYLNKLIHQALHVAKKIRTETGIGELPVSVSYAAVLLAEKIFGNLGETKVLLIGAGEMGALAARHLKERRVQEVFIANRTGEKAAEVAGDLGALTIPYDRIFQKLEEVDIVIASTAATEFLIHGEEVREAMRRRKNRPMFFIDIAVPRNIDPSVNQIENVYLYDIDHLQGIVETNRQERVKEAKKAETIIAQEVSRFLTYLDQRELSPTIRQLSKKFDLIRRQELEKFLARHPDLTARDREGLEAATRAIVNKILHDPIILMKTEEAQDGGPKYSEILKKLFRLE